jgi:hypothetical protein
VVCGTDVIGDGGGGDPWYGGDREWSGVVREKGEDGIASSDYRVPDSSCDVFQPVRVSPRALSSTTSPVTYPHDVILKKAVYSLDASRA